MKEIKSRFSGYEGRRDSGKWNTKEGKALLSNSVCHFSEEKSSDSDSYERTWDGHARDYFTKRELQEVAGELDARPWIRREAATKIESYDRSFSWGGYVLSSRGPVNNWTSGQSRGFEVLVSEDIEKGFVKKLIIEFKGEKGLSGVPEVTTVETRL